MILMGNFQLEICYDYSFQIGHSAMGGEKSSFYAGEIITFRITGLLWIKCVDFASLLEISPNIR